ncbi:MAG TPA: CAP domain-containing protein, partial [Gemmataceae bacterium]
RQRPEKLGALTRPRSPKTLVFVVAIVLLLASLGGGTWLLVRSIGHKVEPVVAANAPEPAPPSRPTEEKPASKPEAKPAEVKPSEDVPPVPKPPLEDKPPPPPPPPPPSPPVEEKKEIALADDLLPELPFHIVDAVNSHRRKAGLEPIFLDAAVSRDCQSRADSLARSAARLTGEEPDFRTADEPLAAIEKWLKEPARRAAILEPRLRTFGAGFARNVAGQWFSVFDWSSGIDREPPPPPASVTGAIVYPAPGQMRVSLWFPGNETPDPLPEAKNKLAGYPVTLTFPLGTRIGSATARLTNKDERDIEVWLSSPEKPANPKHANSQDNTICIIAKRPLRPNTRYLVEVSARVNGEPWSAKWTFTTFTEGELHHEMAGKLLRTLNALRRRAGLSPVPLDAERSKACAAHALYLGANAPANPALSWNAEKPDLPGYSEMGAAVARTAAIQGGGGPVEAVNGLVDSFISRARVLDPRLRSLGLGYTPFTSGGWIWVMDLRRERGSDIARQGFLYPAPDQKEVPLVYPANEVPSPIPPESKDRVAGYAITANFVTRATVKEATAKLMDDKGAVVEGWLSTPEKPAIVGFPQRSLCFLARTPLRPDTRYTMTFKAEVDSRPWERTWSFTTIKEPDRFATDLEEQIVTQVNAVRKAAGLPAVRLDAELSKGCQSHARYLSLNEKRPAAHGLAVHREDMDLPGATAEGARAAKESVIAVVLDPRTCVEGWMATLYHRIPILAPNLERVGFGHASMSSRKWACVLDTGNGRKALSSP